MENIEKVTIRVVPISYAHTKTGVAASPEDITKGELHVYERDGQSPIFVAYESPQNPGPALDSVTEKMADGMKMHYGLRPEQLEWYEKPKNAENFTQVNFREFGAQNDKVGQFGECGRKEGIKKSEIASTISRDIMVEPQLHLKQKQQQNTEPVHLEKETLPSVDIVGTRTDPEQEISTTYRR